MPETPAVSASFEVAASVVPGKGGSAASSLTDRILDGTLRCVAQWGMAKTTIDDVAREAGCSRATVYRTFPGGKPSILHAAGEREVRRFLDDLTTRLETAGSLREMLAVALVEGVTAIRTHEVLQYLMAHEPGPVLALVAFDGLHPLLTLATEFGGPELERYLTPDAAQATAEWVVRMIVTHFLDDCCFDLTDPVAAERLIATYLLPGLAADLIDHAA